MPPPMQAKLLRVLEDGQVRPVGGNREVAVNVRVIAATNRDLEPMIRQGRFREDLFFRLETFRLQVPPLRDRESDIELLAMHFLERYGAAMGRSISGIDEVAMTSLRAWPFPGNVRELANAMERAVTFCNEDLLGEQHLPERMRGGAPLSGEPEAGNTLLDPDERLPAMAIIEQRYVRHVLQRVDGNKQKAARILGIGRRTLYRRLEDDDAAE
jgi:two-component system, NtrC family, response regulator AtoC